MRQSAQRKDADEAPPAAAPERETLFRPEVVSERQTKWLGTVLLQPRVSHRVFAGVAIAAMLAVFAFLIFGSFTRKARINGWLVPREGLVKVFAPQAGVVTALKVREGESVAKGAPLLTISAELRSEAQGPARAQAVERLTSRRESLASETGNQERMFEGQRADLNRRLAALRSEESHLTRETSLQRERLQLAQTAQKRDTEMRARDLIPVTRLEQTKQDRLDQALKLNALERSLSALQRERAQAEQSLREIPLKMNTQLGEISRNVAALEQELAEAETRRSYVVTAPQDGVVTGIQAELGGAAGAAAPLLSIVPAGSVLEAQLFSPSRAIGFLQPGQRVLLRYQAYPYQKFGSYGGVVASVSRSGVSPSELAAPLAGLTSLFPPNDPLYRITVTLDAQTAQAYGKQMRLAPGMQLEADVMTDSRRLIEWMFEPLYSLTGKWSG